MYFVNIIVAPYLYLNHPTLSLLIELSLLRFSPSFFHFHSPPQEHLSLVTALPTCKPSVLFLVFLFPNCLVLLASTTSARILVFFVQLAIAVLRNRTVIITSIVAVHVANGDAPIRYKRVKRPINIHPIMTFCKSQSQFRLYPHPAIPSSATHFQRFRHTVTFPAFSSIALPIIATPHDTQFQNFNSRSTCNPFTHHATTQFSCSRQQSTYSPIINRSTFLSPIQIGHRNPCPSTENISSYSSTTVAVLGTAEILVISAGLSSLALSAALGANDVANSLGTAVGTGAVTVPLALTIGAVMEFAGAVLCGDTVTHTISTSVLSASAAAVAPPLAYILGMLAVTVGCTAWLACATKFGMPVSSTHAVVGALTGLGFVSGWGVNTTAVLRILSSWIFSPVLGGFLAVTLHRFIRLVVLSTSRPDQSARNLVPLLAACSAFILTLSVVSGGRFAMLTRTATAALSLGVSAVVAILTRLISRRNSNAISVPSTSGATETAQNMFKCLQVMTACMLAFSHGSNDVSNAVGPFAAVWATWKGTSLIGGAAAVPAWMLLFGGLGLASGLATFGMPVMRTVGTKITKLQPSMGFCVEFSTSLTVLLASRVGLPVSTTHTLVGCIVALGIADGDWSRVDRKVVASIAASWGVTLPFSALVTVAFYLAVRPLLPAFAAIL